MRNKANPKPPGKCIFCGGPGLTKRHIWADRLKRSIPRDGGSTQVLSEIQIAAGHAFIQPRFREHQGAIHSKQPRNVCKLCNGGWMRAIENAAAYFFEIMIRGGSVSLTRADQTILAAWIASTTIMGEYTDPKTQAIPPDDRRYLMDNRTPPPHWSIYIGRHNGESWKPIRYSHFGVGIAALHGNGAPELITKPNTHFTTQTLGELFIHCFGSSVPGLLRHSADFLDPLCVPIWPVSIDVLRWPGDQTLNDEEANAISNMLPTALLTRYGNSADRRLPEGYRTAD